MKQKEPVRIDFIPLFFWLIVGSCRFFFRASARDNPCSLLSYLASLSSCSRNCFAPPLTGQVIGRDSLNYSCGQSFGIEEAWVFEFAET